ncbi:MAG: SIMPL domain-containing protein [Nitrososphaeraceae archaeon]
MADNFTPFTLEHLVNALPLVAIFLLVFVLCMSFFFQFDSAIAQNSTDNVLVNSSSHTTNVNSTVYTTGSAITRLAPDRVVISVGAETTDKTANDALSLNSGLMSNITSELRNLGLRPNETRTSSFNIFPLYNYTESGTRLNVSGFTVTNTVQIESSNLNNVSQWIDTAVASGANSINSIDFSVSEKRLEDTRSKLITDAIDNAKQKAEAAASAVQLKVIGVKSIIVDGATTVPPLPPQPFFREDAVAQGGTASSSTPIMAGEQEVSVSISCIFTMG